MKSKCFLLAAVWMLLAGPPVVRGDVSFVWDLSGNLNAAVPVATNVPFSFQQTVAPIAVASNATVALSAPANGSGFVSFQWFFNGVPLPGATNDSLLVPNFAASNTGPYYLVASNSLGAVTSAVVSVYFDGDRDGLGDAWEVTYFGNLTRTGLQDFDGDGVSNLDEFLEGTNPANASSFRPRLNLTSVGGTVLTVPMKTSYSNGESVTLTAAPNPGNVFQGWFGSVSILTNPLPLVMNGTKNMTALFGPPGFSLGESLEQPSLVWQTGGDAPWRGQVATNHDGVDAAQSGTITHNQQTWLQTTITNTTYILVRFWWRVDSYDDPLQILVNGAVNSSISGSSGWQQKSVGLPPGTNTLRWVYVKNGTDNQYGFDIKDLAWLDQVEMLPAAGVFLTGATVTEGNIGFTNAVFSIALDAPFSQPVTLNFSTADGTAFGGSDYASTNGSVTFGIGQTNLTVPVAVFGDITIEPNENFWLTFADPTNAVLVTNRTAATILNDDGFPGQIYSFNWSPIPALQRSGEPFIATISARDASNNIVTNFSAPAALSAKVQGTNMLENNISYQYSFGGTYTVGYSFTPNQDMVVTAVRHYFGTKVSIWRDDGTLVAAQTVASTSGTWLETPLSAPVTLLAGQTYRLGAYTGGGNAYYRFDGPGTFSAGTLLQGYSRFGDGFPNSSDSPRWYFVDLAFQQAGSTNLTLNPTNTGNFTNGVWSGPLTLTGASQNVVLRATDGAGHAGNANPLNVFFADDLTLFVSAPSPVTVLSNFTYSLQVVNPGPGTATGVLVTNVLSTYANLVSAVSSQGSCSSNANIVVCDLGTLASGASATMSIVVKPTIASASLTNVATVVRNEPDSNPANDVVSKIVTVSPASLSIADVSVVEGDSGTTNASFIALLNAPSAAIVTAGFQTSDGGAQAGSDYFPTNGVVSFAAGVTSMPVVVVVKGDIQVEGNEVFYLQLLSSTNATLLDGQATGTIINDDGLPGQIHHFAWSTISSPQYSGASFPVTVAAEDYNNNLVTGFSNSVALGLNPPPATNILGDIFHYYASGANYTLGYSFTPAQDILVTGVRHYFGSKISIWRDDGSLVVTQNVSSVPGTWVETALGTPATLLGGQTYRIAAYASGSSGYYRYDGPTNFPDGVLNQSYQSFGDTFPLFSDSVRWWFVDLTYFPVATSNHVALSPTNTAPFTNGVWSGSITLFGFGTNASLLAVDGIGHQGISTPFDLYNADGSPALLGQPRSQNQVVGDTATFCVSAVGITPLYYQWRRNGSDITGATNGCHVLSNVQTNDAAVYSVVVSNAVTSVLSSNATLTIFVPITITVQPAGQIVSAGTNVVFSVQADGTQPLAYQWQKDGSPIFGATGSSYTLTNVQFLDSGFFSVVISNAAGTVTSDSAELVVISPPFFYYEPESLTVGVNMNANSYVGADGTPPLTYQWFRNGSPLALATNDYISLLSVQFADAGNYSVIVSNIYGFAASSNAVLTVVPPPGNDQFSNRFVITGLSNTVTGHNLGATKEPGEPNHAGNPGGDSVWWTWTSPTNDVISFDTLGSSISALLAIYTGSDVSNLALVASNDFFGGGSFSLVQFPAIAGVTYQIAVDGYYGDGGTLQLTVRPPPPAPVNDNFTNRIVLTGLTNTTTAANLFATLENGEPEPAGVTGGSSLWWTWTAPANGPVTVDTIGSSFDTILGVYTGTVVSNLTLVADDDDGGLGYTSLVTFTGSVAVAYQIVVDGYGGDLGNIILHVRQTPSGPPMITQQPQSLSIAAGHGALFSVTAVGAAPLRYQWQKDAVPISGATNDSLNISAAQTSDAGNYRVVITNTLGSVTSSVAVLTVSPALLLQASVQADQLVLSFNSVPGTSYTVQYADTLTSSWNVLTNLTATGASVVLSDPIGVSTQRYYRVFIPSN